MLCGCRVATETLVWGRDLKKHTCYTLPLCNFPSMVCMSFIAVDEIWGMLETSLFCALLPQTFPGALHGLSIGETAGGLEFIGNKIFHNISRHRKYKCNFIWVTTDQHTYFFYISYLSTVLEHVFPIVICSWHMNVFRVLCFSVVSFCRAIRKSALVQI